MCDTPEPIDESWTYGAGDGAGAEQIAGSEVAAGHGVVHQLLLHRPVHVLEVGAADDLRSRRLGRLEGHLELDVVAVAKCWLSELLATREEEEDDDNLPGLGVLVLEVGKRLGLILLGALHAEGLKSFQGNHPRRDGADEILE